MDNILTAGVRSQRQSQLLHELRVRLEALGLDAEAKRAWILAADGTPIRDSAPIESLALRNLAFQIRYRYQFAPLSYLYVAYVRGG